jgi:uncharacterized protein (DUF486 family)
MLQEVATLAVFTLFAAIHLQCLASLSRFLGFTYIALGARFIFKGPIPVSWRVG